MGLNDPPDRSLTQCGAPIYKDSFFPQQDSLFHFLCVCFHGLSNHIPEMGLDPASGRSQSQEVILPDNSCGSVPEVTVQILRYLRENLNPHETYDSGLLESNLDLAVFSRPSHGARVPKEGSGSLKSSYTTLLVLSLIHI